MVFARHDGVIDHTICNILCPEDPFLRPQLQRDPYLEKQESSPSIHEPRLQNRSVLENHGHLSKFTAKLELSTIPWLGRRIEKLHIVFACAYTHPRDITARWDDQKTRNRVRWTYRFFYCGHRGTHTCRPTMKDALERRKPNIPWIGELYREPVVHIIQLVIHNQTSPVA
jgi:hypothetical protein